MRIVSPASGRAVTTVLARSGATDVSTRWLAVVSTRWRTAQAIVIALLAQR